MTNLNKVLFKNSFTSLQMIKRTLMNLRESMTITVYKATLTLVPQQPNFLPTIIASLSIDLFRSLFHYHIWDFFLFPLNLNLFQLHYILFPLTPNLFQLHCNIYFLKTLNFFIILLWICFSILINLILIAGGT